jgi:hypothetical protein
MNDRRVGALFLFGTGALFDVHVFEFTGFEDIATLEALDEFGVLFARDNLHAWVLTRIHRGFSGCGSFMEWLCTHMLPAPHPLCRIARYFSVTKTLVKSGNRT